MKNIFFFFFLLLSYHAFSQMEISSFSLGVLIDIDGNELKDELLEDKYILVYNSLKTNDVDNSYSYYNEVAGVFKNAFFNSDESKGLIVLVFLNSDSLHNSFKPLMSSMVLIPINSEYNSKILKYNNEFFNFKNALIDSEGILIERNLDITNLRLDLAKYLKRN